MALEGVINIPTDVYSYSGLPKDQRTSLLSSLMPQLTSAATNLPGTISSGMDTARGTIANLGNFYKSFPQAVTPYAESAARGFKGATEGAFSGVLGNLSKRGLLNSSIFRDTMSSLGTQLNDQQFGQINQAGMNAALEGAKGQADALTKQATLDATQAEMMGNVPGILAQIAELGKATEDPFQPYQAYMNLIPNL